MINIFRYGYHQNQQQRGYYFSQPHVMHQFTMRDVPGKNSAYREKATDIEILQSHSFEIKEGDYNPDYSQQTSAHNYQQEQVYEDPVPVIVLRIPGPQKYALHLQALLQQYLEIRAAQYIKALEDQERHGHLMHPQHYVTQQQQQHHHQMQYVPMIAITPVYQQYYQQQPPQHSGFQQYYKVHHGNSYQVPAGEQSYYPQPQIHQQAQQEYHEAPTQPQQEYPTSFSNFVTPVYEQSELHHQSQHNHHQEEPLLTSENYPSDKHTQVIFKKKKRVHRPVATYRQSAPIVVPDPPAHDQEEVYQHQPETVHHSHEPQIHHNHQSEAEAYGHQSSHNEYQADAQVVSVTQRTMSPYNYHVVSTLAPSHEELHERHNPKRMAPFSKEQFEKARRIMMNKSKRNHASIRPEKMMVKPMDAPSS